MESSKAKVKKKLPDAYCVKLYAPINGHHYIVWPGKVAPRGCVTSAIGAGRTAAEAWKDAGRGGYFSSSRKRATP
jgi:hypothetical protein